MAISQVSTLINCKNKECTIYLLVQNPKDYINYYCPRCYEVYKVFPEDDKPIQIRTRYIASSIYDLREKS